MEAEDKKKKVCIFIHAEKRTNMFRLHFPFTGVLPPKLNREAEASRTSTLLSSATGGSWSRCRRSFVYDLSSILFDVCLVKGL